MVKPGYSLRTARLALRPYLMSDFDDLHDIQSRPEVTRYLRGVRAAPHRRPYRRAEYGIRAGP
jgi:RimJ/RimL family protein N-acetyltransferase